jgi:UDP-N-acetylglucosamine diphosphorylase/glucosamine-1-phosphate N-acetyltransferase
MNLVLFDDPAIRVNLLPFTYTRPVATIRTGILTIAEKWELRLKRPVSFLTEDYLTTKYPLLSTSDNLLVNGAVCPDDAFADAIRALKPGEGLQKDLVLLAFRSSEAHLNTSHIQFRSYDASLTLIDQAWKIFQHNGAQIRSDFAMITAGRTSAPVNDAHTIVYRPENIFIEEGVTIRAAVLNAEDGPIYLGKNSIVQEGSLIRGPFSLGESSHVNMGAKMRGDNTIGPHCKVGGEISNSVLFGYSNKAHDGFIGNTVLGEWCNLGADTNTSNLKNNYEAVKLWHHGKGGFVNTGLQFCGLMMGDHSKCGINTMFNTGTVVGVSSNIFGDGFPRNFIPSFAWGGASGFTTYQVNKAFETATKVFERRKMAFDEVEQQILRHVFELTASHRIWEKNK